MTDSQIKVRSLSKEYKVPVREGGFKASVASLFRRRYQAVHAVTDISFDVAAGEIVGFLGPNGAGKTTTLKMLAGLLHPTSGEASVMGYPPWQRDPGYLRRMTLVMGQKNQLEWDIPAMDTFLVNKAIYNVPERDFDRRVREYAGILELEGLLTKPVRNLSLGERMKCELVAALLHAPQVLFLDEPTLGLDVTMQNRIRDFIREYNRRHQASVLLTSHYMADIAALCDRVIIIHNGRLMFDGDLQTLVTKIAPFKILDAALGEVNGDGLTAFERGSLERYGELVSFEEGRFSLKVPKEKASGITAQLLSELPLLDLTISDPPIEDVIDQVFQEGIGSV